MNKKNNQKAFTLFELLVSISIIAILTAVAMTSFSGAQRKARDSRRISDMNSVQKAAEQYYSFSNYVYPVDTAPSSWVTTSGQIILDIFPIDPKGGLSNSYIYNSGVGLTTFCACATLENNTGNSINQTCTSYVNGTGTYYCVKNQQ